jgi:hypothetical protein
VREIAIYVEGGVTLHEAADSGRASKTAEGDSLADDLLRSNPEFQALVAKSKAGPRKPFPPATQ